MMNSGGDGGLSTAIELKEFTKVDMDIDNIKDARLVAQAFKDTRDYQRSTTRHNNEPMRPELEIDTTKTQDGKFIVWYRDCK